MFIEIKHTAYAINIAGTQILDRVSALSPPCAWGHIREVLFGSPHLSTELHGAAQGDSKMDCNEAPHPGCTQMDNPEPESSAQGGHIREVWGRKRQKNKGGRKGGS